MTFNFEGSNNLLQLYAGSLTLKSEANPFGQCYVNGHTNIGNQSSTNTTTYVPVATSAVPEPAAWAVMLLDFGFVGGSF